MLAAMGRGVVLGCVLVALGFALTCSAATLYIVGDSSGWDISTNLDTWTEGKNFTVGDVLSFQYAPSNSVYEVTKDNFNACNLTDPILTSSNGNTSITLDRPGDWYFVSGNRLYCLGGMKLHATVQGKPAASASPASAPEASGVASGAPGYLPRPSSKNNNPAAVQNSSGGGRVSPISAALVSMATLLWMLTYMAV